MRLLLAPWFALLFGFLFSAPSAALGAEDPPAQSPAWTPLFNGRDIADWIPKFNHHDPGENFANTFRVADGMIQVRYDDYKKAFNGEFGNLFYKRPFSRYRLAVEYRFVGQPYPGIPDWARFNSGVMFHSQDPHKILRDQEWPISVEFQFLASLGDGQPRATGNVCSPGSHVHHDGQLVTQHIIESSGPTIPPGEWVRAELLVDGDRSITHFINGQKVLEYSRPIIGGEVLGDFDPAEFVDGRPLTSGFIALQAEGQPIDFRKVEIQLLDK
jgi:hypothetical protein